MNNHPILYGVLVTSTITPDGHLVALDPLKKVPNYCTLDKQRAIAVKDHMTEVNRNSHWSMNLQYHLVTINILEGE